MDRDKPTPSLPLTADEAAELGEFYIPWHPHNLTGERCEAWAAIQREKELAAFRERRVQRMAELGMRPASKREA